MRHVLAVLVVGAGAAWLLAGCGGTEATSPGGDELTIAVIPKGTTHEFWKSVHAGARKAESELDGVRVIWQGPIKEDDRDAQIQVVETFIGKRVDGLVVAPLDDRALVRPIQAAGRAGIPVVIIDSGLQDADAYASFVATDNRRGGELAGTHLAELLGPEGGKVMLLRYQLGSASTENREAGFLAAMERHPEIEVVSKDQYAGATVESAMTAAETLLASPDLQDVDGIFCPNESSTYGMLQALRARNRAGQVVFVGFDVSDKLLQALQAGELHGLVVQNPLKMGEKGVETVVQVIRGTAVPKRIDTGVVLVTKDSFSDPDVERLLHPPLEEYLK